MLIRIPEKVKEFQIVKDMMSMIKEFQKEREITDQSFDLYYEESAKSAIRQFLDLVLEADDPEFLEIKKNYLTEKLYRAKGTREIFTYLRDQVGMDYSWNYSPGLLEITINTVYLTVDMTTYVDSLTRLLEDLVFYRKIKYEIKTIIQRILGKSKSSLDISSLGYNKIVADEL